MDWDIIFPVRKILLFKRSSRPLHVARFLRQLVEDLYSSNVNLGGIRANKIYDIVHQQLPLEILSRKSAEKEDVDSAVPKVVWSSSVGQAGGICGNEDYIVFQTISRNEERNQDEKYMLVTPLHNSLQHYLSYSLHPSGSLSDGV